MLDDMKGKVALVTGASRGLGLAMAMALAEPSTDLAVNLKSAFLVTQRVLPGTLRRPR